MLADDPLWYKDAIIYELHVRAYHDHVGDGMGDFRGLTQKLDYLQDLGVTVIWLLPFYPSPLRDDGYDIADYTEVHPHYGTLRDFQEFLDAAHRHGLRVITELVINHTSDQHPWFQRARRAPPGSPERDFYVWSESPEKYAEARIIFKDFEHSNWSWDPVARAYYWHRFYAHQPDLNYDNPAVWQAIMPLADYWFGMGVDGMRLDAIPYLYEREGTGCENLPETHGFLKALRQHVDAKFPNRMLLGEANQWPEDSVAYFGDGDECHMAFNFPVMPRLFMAIHMEDRYPILDIMAQTPKIPENCQWGLFLRNHDELTLEMVTDEERDYMYRAYASDPRARINLGIRRRLAPLLGNNRRRIELMNGLLFSLPGTPVIYYGDEIGMGDNIYLGDRNGVRTPMQWSGDRNAGFSRANPQKLYLPVIIDPEYHYEAVNVEAQQNNPSSLLWWTKRLIALRKRYQAFGRGTLEFLQPGNRKILAFLRRNGEENILVVANLSRFVQHVELDLARLQGSVPVEMFGQNRFPRVGKQPYSLTLGPHAFYWFALEPSPADGEALTLSAETVLGVIAAPAGWESLFAPADWDRLEKVLPAYLQQRPWLSGQARDIKTVTIRDAFRIGYADTQAFLTLVEAEMAEGPLRTYVLPLALAQENQVMHLLENEPASVVAYVQGEPSGVLFDALGDPRFCMALLEAIGQQKIFLLPGGELRASLEPAARQLLDGGPQTPSLLREAQSNTLIRYGDQLVLKVFRRVEEGVHPDLETSRYLTQRRFPAMAPYLGAIEYRQHKSAPVTLAVLHGYVPNEGTAWQYTLDELSYYFERVLALPERDKLVPTVAGPLLDLTDSEPPPPLQDLIGRYLDSARMLGERAAELHLALTADGEQAAFAPEPFSMLYQRSLYQSMRNVAGRILDRLRLHQDQLPAELQGPVGTLLASENAVLERFRAVMGHKIKAQRARYHGDYNLAEVLYTGKDFAIIDFEGDRSRTLSDRQTKRCPLRDVVSMVRSFHYAASIALLGGGGRRGNTPGLIRPEDVPSLDPWAWAWAAWVSAAFLRAYEEKARLGNFLPTSAKDYRVLFDVFLLEKSFHELGHELRHRRDWAAIPLRGILRQMDIAEEGAPQRKPEAAEPSAPPG